MNKVNNMSLNACMIWWPQFGARHDLMHARFDARKKIAPGPRSYSRLATPSNVPCPAHQKKAASRKKADSLVQIKNTYCANSTDSNR